MTSAELLTPIAAAAEGGDIELRMVGVERGAYFGFEPLREFRAEATLDEVVPTDLLIIPGGLGSIRMMEDQRVLEWLRLQADVSTYVMSVSTGSLLLAAAGLLRNAEASGHWLAHDDLARAGAHPADDAVTWWGKYVTTSGHLAAADVSRRLPERLRYGPRP